MCKWRFYLNGTVVMASRSLESLDAVEWIKTLAWQQESDVLAHIIGAHERADSVE